jgi:hypothetical protein
MGPGSVSSLLKIALDVVHVILWVVVGALVLAAIANLFVPISSSAITAAAENGTRRVLTGPMVSIGLLVFAVYVGGVLAIVLQLRRIFGALTAGDPFHPDNVGRLRLVGLILAGLEVGNMLARMGGAWAMTGDRLQIDRIPDLTGWFSVLVVFVLAEVFREGARLRGDAELTI